MRLIVALLAATEVAAAAPRPLAEARQLVVVTTAGWSEATGRLQRFARRRSGEPWAAVGRPVAVVVGRRGLAWGRGLHDAPQQTSRLSTDAAVQRDSAAPQKKEGDGAAPAGLFRLGPAFGRAPRIATALPYRPLTPATRCVDDAASRRYNQLVEERPGRAEWASAEAMHELYVQGAVIAHNWERPVAGAGSCIFLHPWVDGRQGTAGCTAMADADLAALLAWLDARRGPLLLQLPGDEYARRRRRWSLPDLAAPTE